MVLLKLGERYTQFPNCDGLQELIEVYLVSVHTSFDNFFFCCASKVLSSFEALEADCMIEAKVRLRGGKGGYGAKLKSEGGKKVRPNDNMFSRDINGRKMYYTTIEKDYTEFYKAKTQEDRQVQQEREQFRIMESTLKEGQSFMKLDRVYNQLMQDTEQNLFQSIKIGRQHLLQKAKKAQNQRTSQESSELKRVNECDEEEEEGLPQKKRKILEELVSKVAGDEVVSKREEGKPLSARDKLKSLFKT